jgi:hypothetical protein
MWLMRGFVCALAVPEVNISSNKKTKKVFFFMTVVSGK